MLSLADVDHQFIKCIGYLHTNNYVPVKEGNPIALQNFLEEAIKNKTGVMKDLSNIVVSCLKQEQLTDEFKPTITGQYEESKASNSDNELELDLLKEDLMCVVCNGMDVAARNRLLECSDCHALYHQECHNPAVVLEDSFSSWICHNCKESKKPKPPATETPEPSPSCPSTKPSKSSSHRHSSTSSSSSYKSTSSNSSSKSSEKYKSNSPKNLPTSTTTASSTSSSSSRSGLSPNINIISADKRIQNMKKKAAKMQEKRKQLPR